MSRQFRGTRESPELNMPAMIDVVFLLIIFFMTASELTISHAELLRLPVADHAEEQRQVPGGWVVINVRTDGSASIRGGDVDVPSLRAILAKEVESSRPPSGEVALVVLIRSDASTPTGSVQNILNECVKLGIYRVYFAALRERPTSLGAL
jgi:biopolymer transport protein ExbD